MEKSEIHSQQEFRVANSHADCAVYPITDNAAGFRLYRDTPSTFLLQIRSKTTKQDRTSSVSLTFEQMRALKDWLVSRPEVSP